MSIRNPVKADVDIRNAFEDVAQEIAELKRELVRVRGLVPPQLPTTPTPTTNLDLAFLNPADLSSGNAPPGSVLTSDGLGNPSWAPPLDGLVTVGPAGEGGRSAAQPVLGVNGSLAVLSGLSADSVRCRTLRVVGSSDFPRRLHTNVTPDAVSDGTLQDLMAYTVPGGTLATDGSYLHVVASGQTAANGNAKVVTLNWGSYTVDYLTGVINNLDWVIEGWIIRLSATTQLVVSKGGWNGNMLYCQEGSGTETLSGGVVVKCTGDGVAASDITQTSLLVEYYP